MSTRKGMATGQGKGYKNIAGSDPRIHSQSAKGISQPQRINPIISIPNHTEALKDYDDYLKKQKERRKTNYEELDREQRKIIENIDKEKYGNYLIGDLRQTMYKYQDKTNWKKPFTAIVNTPEEADKLATAIRFFMADEPRVELNNINSPAEIKKGNFYKKTPSYSVTTRGYQAW